MSKASPISVRIASRTRCFETTGDSSYYYSSQLLTNVSFLKTLSQLGQQLGWVVKSNEAQSLQKQTNTDLSRIGLDLKSLPRRREYGLSLDASPGKEWISANSRLVKKLSISQQFFNSKAIGFLSKSIGRSQLFDPNYLLSKGLSVESSPIWTDCFSTLSQLAKFSPTRVYKKAERPKDFGPNEGAVKRKEKLLQQVKSLGPQHSRKRPGHLVSSDNIYEEKYPANKTRGKEAFGPNFLGLRPTRPGLLGKLRNDSKLVFKTPVGLPLYVSALGLACHNQVLRNSLAIVPIVVGSLQSDLLLSNHKGVLRTASSSGIGLVSSNPGVYISRSVKDTVLNIFLRIPSPLITSPNKSSLAQSPEVKLDWRRARKAPLHQTFIIGDLGVEKKRKSARLRATYTSIRWS